MKYLHLFIFSLLSLGVAAQTPCVDGFAGPYPCDNVDLLTTMTTDEIGGAANQADIWGWTSASGREFAIVTKSNATAFVEVTDPLSPVYLGDLPTHTINSLWRDAKVFNNHAFIVSEAEGHGMQVFDLTQLLGVQDPPITFEETAHYPGFGNAHNIAMNEDTGFAYAIGTNTFAGGLHIIDVTDPLTPLLVGAYEDDGYTHDCQVVLYHGPDTDYCGAEIAFNSNEDAVTIVDVTDKTDCQLLDTKTYDNVDYTHQCWLTEDHQYLLVNDERDELNGLVTNTTTYVWDVRDLDNIELIGEYNGTSTSIDHNLYVRWNQVFQSNYRSGLRILDASKVADGSLSEVGFFDCQPEDDLPNDTGTWSNYCYFNSGIVVMTDMYGDFFILQPRTITADFTQTIIEGDDDVNFNVYLAYITDGQINANGLPEGVEASSSTINELGMNEIQLTGTQILVEGYYPFTIVVSENGTDHSFDAGLFVQAPSGDLISTNGPDNVATVGAQPAFSWDVNFDSGSLLLEIATDPDFENLLYDEVVTSSPIESPISFLDGTYYWRLSTIPICDEEPIYSDVAEFTVLIVGVEEAKDQIWSAFPIPCNSELTVQGLAGERIILSDFTGRVVFEKILISEKETLDVSILPVGQYLLTSSHGSTNVMIQR